MVRLFHPDWREVWKGLRVPESGTVYTKRPIAALLLDLLGYTADRSDLLDMCLLEPSCGDGVFLREVMARVCASLAGNNQTFDWMDPRWETVVTAVDISGPAVQETQDMLDACLREEGCPLDRSRELTAKWVFQTDFLLHPWAGRRFDFVVGNPPYVRLENMPAQVRLEYRDLWSTATDRADLYIPFFECGLELLSDTGALGFICANRFAKNQYGAALRKLIARSYHVRDYINLEHTQPFEQDVSAYPALIVIDRRHGEPTLAASLADVESSTLDRLRTERAQVEESGTILHRFNRWYPDGSPWVSTCRRRQASLEALVRSFPTIEESLPGTRIGIGIATGADDVFVLPSWSSRIESDRLVPLAMAGDVRSGEILWSGHYLVNPFHEADDGRLVDLGEYPGLAAHFAQHADRLKARHCAKNRVKAWYRTIDRFNPRLLGKPKLLIPDIQPGGVVAFDPGGFYPHHNLYWITSESWDLIRLKEILQSDLVTEQIRAHSVQMRGGSIRYQAQNLRKVRIPRE